VKRRLFVLAAWSVSLSLGAGPAPKAVPAAGELAVVDGETIDAAALKTSVATLGPRGEALLVNPSRRRQQLEQLIDTRLLARAATASGMADDPEFQRLVNETAARLLAERYLERTVRDGVTPAATKAFFKANQARYGSRELRAEHLLFGDEATAKAALAEAKKPGADFGALRGRFPAPASVAPSQAGGDLGWFRRGGMVPEFEAAAFATPVGAVHDQPVKTPFGWHVLRVTDARGSDAAEFDAVKPQVEEDLRAHLRAEAVRELRAKARVTVNEAAVRDFQ
jgi:peptidyl-prolyl cis-trans isomerase C